MKGKNAERLSAALTERGYEAQTVSYEGLKGVSVPKSQLPLPAWWTEQAHRDGLVADRDDARPGNVLYRPKSAETRAAEEVTA